MPRPRKWESDHERRTAQNDARKRAREDAPTHFVGVDGEGIGRGRDHKYVLLGVADLDPRTDSKGLSWDAIAVYLYECYQRYPGSAFTGFYLGYDFTQWFARLPEERARRLLTEPGIASRQRRTAQQLGPFPVRFNDWEFDILGMKRFKLRPVGEKGWLYVCDAGPFFQTSLMKALDPAKWPEEPVVSEKEYATLATGKARRDSAELDSRMVEYNRLENLALARLMGRYETGLRAAGIRLRKDEWFGPGQAAQKWLSTTEAPTSELLRNMSSLPPGQRGRASERDAALGSKPAAFPDGLLDAAQATYYGGWFEIFAHGHISGQSWEYDINSAYPAIASQLPCVLHGKWSAGNGIPGELGEHSIRVVHCTVRGSDRQVGAALHRTAEGTIRRPYLTRGYYWESEIDASVRCGLIDSVDYLEWWQYDPCPCPPPLRELATLYAQRLAVGKNSAHGKALKLVYNSVYGKLAQSIGSPRFGNSIYASLITSGCRVKIIDAYGSHPSKRRGAPLLLMVATDAIFFSERHTGLPISEKLGEWDEVSRSNLVLFKPGIYWDDSTRERLAAGMDPVFKSRGIKASDFGSEISSIDNHYRSWGEHYPAERDPRGSRVGWHPEIKFTSGFSMVTAQQALQWHKWWRAGTLGHEPMPGVCDGCDGNHLVQDADPITKRHSGWKENGIYWSSPYPDGGGGDIESTPYDKRFGQPDPDEYGLTDDGSVKNSWGEMLR